MNTNNTNDTATLPNSIDSKDEIVFEIKHKIGLFDTIQYIVLTPLCVGFLYVLLFEMSDDIDFIWFVLVFLFGFGVIFFADAMLYSRKNRFYVTTQGIGFERRHWFRMQRGFYRFGEVGMGMSSISLLHFNTGMRIFVVCPINLTINTVLFPYLRDKNYKHYTFYTLWADLYNKDKKPILAFIRQKTKEALESRGITISDEELKEKIKDLNYKDL